jgi:hypothetical protein
LIRAEANVLSCMQEPQYIPAAPAVIKAIRIVISKGEKSGMIVGWGSSRDEKTDWHEGRATGTGPSIRTR